MRRRYALPGLVAAAVVGALVAGILLATRPSRDTTAQPIRVGSLLTPRTPLFGDTVKAQIEFAGDARRIVPGSVRAAFYLGLYGIELLCKTGFDRGASHGLGAIVFLQLQPHRVFRLPHLMAPVPALDQLFGAERDQHADDDDPDLAEKFAPAMERLWQVNVHESPPAT